jgi:hypothetical protein
MFQLDVVSEAVQQVISAGVIYVAAAGDSGAHGYQAPWATVSGTFTFPTTSGGSQTLTNLENFGDGPFLKINVTTTGDTTSGISFSVDGISHSPPRRRRWSLLFSAAARFCLTRRPPT